MTIVNDTNFETEVLKSELPVLVDFYADWCGPCKMMAPIVEELSNQVKDRAKVVKINVDESPETSERYNIMSIPTFVVFKGGQPVQQKIGGMPKDALASMLD